MMNKMNIFEYSAQMPLIHTIKSSLLQTSARVMEIEKKLSIRTKKFTEYVHSNDMWKEKTDKELERIILKLDDLNTSIGKIDVYIKEIEIKKNVWSKFWEVLQKIPKTLIGLIGVISAFASFALHYIP